MPDDIRALTALVHQDAENIRALTAVVREDAVNIRALARIAAIHEHRLTDLEK